MHNILSNYKTTIVVTKGTRDRLASLGKKDDTFDALINKLLDEREDE
jgi:hypothetical protein